jgi:hypothetical protein
MVRRLCVALLAAVLGACSLLTSVSGLSGGPDPDPVDSGDAASVEAAPSDALLAQEADVDAGPSRSDSYALAVLADQPLGYWRLDESAGPTAKDETGRHDGVYVSAPSLGVPGVAGSRAMKLARDTGAHIEVASSDFHFATNAPYSVELWASAGDQKKYQWLGGTEHRVDNARSGWSVFAQDQGLLRYEVWASDGDGGSDQRRGVLITESTTVGAFHHIVVAYTGSAVIGYVDGLQTASLASTAAAPDNGDLVWGCRGDLSACLDDWVIDELAIYDFVLTGGRVKAHYDLGK